jgi:hypothetical protein
MELRSATWRRRMPESGYSSSVVKLRSHNRGDSSPSGDLTSAGCKILKRALVNSVARFRLLNTKWDLELTGFEGPEKSLSI